MKSEQMDASHCHEIENNPTTNIMQLRWKLSLKERLVKMLSDLTVTDWDTMTGVQSSMHKMDLTGKGIAVVLCFS